MQDSLLVHVVEAQRHLHEPGKRAGMRWGRAGETGSGGSGGVVVAGSPVVATEAVVLLVAPRFPPTTPVQQLALWEELIPSASLSPVSPHPDTIAASILTHEHTQLKTDCCFRPLPWSPPARLPSPTHAHTQLTSATPYSPGTAASAHL